MLSPSQTCLHQVGWVRYPKQFYLRPPGFSFPVWGQSSSGWPCCISHFWVPGRLFDVLHSTVIMHHHLWLSFSVLLSCPRAWEWKVKDTTPSPGSVAYPSRRWDSADCWSHQPCVDLVVYRLLCKSCWRSRPPSSESHICQDWRSTRIFVRVTSGCAGFNHGRHHSIQTRWYHQWCSSFPCIQAGWCPFALGTHPVIP